MPASTQATGSKKDSIPRVSTLVPQSAVREYQQRKKKANYWKILQRRICYFQLDK
ncbi:uncharacterized protein ACLA_045890 [Aspergillus clavatus NRRL 1]|uniref:Uncharacterized protein n=1 Tax=Aspergillus clavatus (strain ATCC 1007 / CBS 513.65 / DSM 816 / NCTC 3887 / NRRL 1 / QM 1276 / 107) TaxID=344612 RepID=A1CGW9_ASPCL|nr:uncharacterized protein ACLA_045890 [Aspergillus clavatus NRRL 1]EAW10124.1 hypothetical protein ACLA_045890 [Aspergillus clavatus NRRL 1]